jgi:hypothetical protein
VLATWANDGIPPARTDAGSQPDGATELSLVVDGTAHPFGRLDPQVHVDDSAWLAVPREGGWSMRATYDGEAQGIDPTSGERAPGRAAAYDRR